VISISTGWRSCCVLILLLVPAMASAHALGQSYIFLTIEGEAIRGRFEVNVVDVNRVLGTDLETGPSLSAAEVTPHIDRLKAYLHERVAISAAGAPARIVMGDHDVAKFHGSQYVQIDFDLEGFPPGAERFDIDYRVVFDVDRAHRGLLVIENDFESARFNNERQVSLIFGPGNERQTLDLSSSSPWRGFLGTIGLGVHHIWIGIDHILFLIALLLPSVLHRRNGRWIGVDGFRAALIHVIKIVTLFTIAHSITLSLAVLGLVQVSSRVVESIIAISIAFAALDILVPVFRGRIGIVVFLFGLFHGFGFASVLAEMGIAPKFLALSLIGFNLGVELGQAVIVAMAFPVLFLIRSTVLYTRIALRPAAALLIAVSLYWFVERAFDVDVPILAAFRNFV
jgi:hypothetical protein